MTRPHILIPLHDFNAGGTELIAFRLAGEWLARGWQVTFLAGDQAGQLRGRVPAGADVTVLDPPITRSPLSRLRLGKALAAVAKTLSPEIIFIPGNFHFVVAHAFKQALPTVPVVAKISNPLLPGGMLARLGVPVLRAYLAPIDAFAAMSHGLAMDLRRALPQAAVATILDPNIADNVVPPLMRDLRASPGPVRLLAIGRLEPQKDFALALRVLGELAKTTPVHLTLLGEGYLRARLEQLAAKLQLGTQLAMPGYVADTAAAFAAANVLLITSRFEGGPATAVEALAYGVPVVSTDCSHFLHDVITDPRLGRLVRERSPAALAAAISAQLACAPAPPDLLKAAIEPSRYAASADAYLALFAGLLASKSA